MRRIACTAAVCLLGAALLSAASPPASRPEGLPLADALAQDDWDTFSMEITHLDTEVKSDGTPIPYRTEMRKYRWLRVAVGDRWRTTVTTLDATQRIAKGIGGEQFPVGNPKTISRLEDDEDGTMPRLYDFRGKLITPPDLLSREERGTRSASRQPTKVIRAATRGREWIDTFILSRRHHARRTAKLESSLGRAQGRVRGLDRYLRQSGGETVETLVDPEFAAIRELNIVRAGKLVSHSRIDYVAHGGGLLMKRGMRTESAARDGKGGRTIREVAFGAVQLSRRGGR